MSNLNKSKLKEKNPLAFDGKHLVKFVDFTDHGHILVLRFETLSGWYLGGLDCYVNSDGFWLEVCGTDDPSSEEIKDRLKEPMLATVEKLDVGKDRPKVIHITKLESLQ